MTGSGALRGRGTKLVVLLVLGVLFFYLVLPPVVESLIARSLQSQFHTSTKPDVEVSSIIPPMMLVGRIDSVQVTMDQLSLQGRRYNNARADLEGVSVSVPSLIAGNLEYETEGCSLFINQNQKKCPNDLRHR